jgi:uncharacterized protein
VLEKLSGGLCNCSTAEISATEILPTQMGIGLFREQHFLIEVLNREAALRTVNVFKAFKRDAA